MIEDYELTQKVKALKTESAVREYVEKYLKEEQDEHFHEYLRQHILKHDLSMAQVMKNSCINKNYGYNITNGTRKRPGREKVIALCIGAKMCFDETQKALRLAEHPLLNPRKERDVWIALAINNKTGDVLKLNLLLEEKGLEPLSV